MMNKVTLWTIVTGIAYAVFLQQPAFCATLYVPDDHSTIQTAIDAAWGGDTIIVRAGTYSGEGNKNLYVNKVITIQSESGPGNTIIDCEGEGRGFYFENVSNFTRLEGLSIINGLETRGGAIRLQNASPIIKDCIMNGNHATATSYGGGGGIYSYNSSPVLINCVITSNISNAGGGGIYCQQSSTPTLVNCTLAYNNAPNGGGIRTYDSCRPVIRNSILYFDAAPQEIYGATSQVTYSNIMGGYEGEGNIDANPLLAAGGDFHLQGSSPCIDTALADDAAPLDIDQEVRPHGAGCDMGADEYDGIPVVEEEIDEPIFFIISKKPSN